MSSLAINHLVALGIVELEGDQIRETRDLVAFRDKHRAEIQHRVKTGLAWLENFGPIKDRDGQIATASVIIQYFPDPTHPKTNLDMIGLFEEVKILASLYAAYYREVVGS